MQACIEIVGCVRGFRHGILMLLMLAVCVVAEIDCAGQVIVRDDLQGPLIENEPFDLLTLNAANNGAVIKIAPPQDLKLPLDRLGILVFEFATDSEFPLQVPNAAIASYETFNDLLMDEAQQMMDRGQLSLAFRNLLYVYDHGGKSDNDLVRTLERCLFLDARKKLDNGEFEIALSIFEDLYQKQPDFKIPRFNRTLQQVVLDCYDGIIEKRFSARDFELIRRTLDVLDRRYGNDGSDFIKKWNLRLFEYGDELLLKARQLADLGKGREAHLAARNAERASPGRAVNERVQAEIMERFPLIMVGVNQRGGPSDPARIDHWGSRRVGRMIERSIVEVTGLSDEGARYDFSNGDLLRLDDVGRVYAFDLHEQKQSQVPPLTSFQLASQLLAHANPESEHYDATWAQVLRTVEVRSQSRVIVELLRPFVRPEALMQIPYPDALSETVSSSEPATARKHNGRYTVISNNSESSFYGANPAYFAIDDEKHPVLVEQFYRSDSDAVDALIRGDLDMIDRVPPSDIARLKGIDSIQVRSYVIPSVHLLIPKIRGGLGKSYRFRNALSTGIDRQSIVENIIVGSAKEDREIDGCVPLSGPFPVGGDDNDQLSYGHDPRVKPLIYNDRLAMALKNLAIKLEGDNNTNVGPGDGLRPSIVLAHPNSPLVRSCAETIARSWNSIGIRTTLRQLPDGVAYPQDDQWDILYSELQIEDPLVDAFRIFGPAGLTDDISAPVEQYLRGLATAQSWQQACLTLRNIHRQVAVDLSVIPLYQVTEHFAFRDNVYNVGRDLVHLYQYVDRWKIETVSQAKRRKQLLQEQ